LTQIKVVQKTQVLRFESVLLFATLNHAKTNRGHARIPIDDLRFTTITSAAFVMTNTAEFHLVQYHDAQIQDGGVLHRMS